MSTQGRDGTERQSYTLDAAWARCAKPTSTAFVTLGKVADRVAAEQLVLSHESRAGWRIRAAPEPHDILWRNAAISLTQMRAAHRIMMFGNIFAFLFWAVPVGGIQAWATVDKIASVFPGVVRWLRRRSLATQALVTGYLPVIALIGLSHLLPYIIEELARRVERHKVKSDIERIVLLRYFGYQIATLYVTVLSGSLWGSLQDILRRPVVIFELLRMSIPGVAVYFMIFVLTQTCINLPMYLLRPWDMINCGTCESTPVRCYVGMEAASSALVLVLGLTYAFIAPAILPICALYFGCASLVYRFLFAYVYEPEYDSSGFFWYELFKCISLGLFLGTLSFLALMALYADYRKFEFIVLLPLPGAVALLHWYCMKHFGHAANFMAYEDAVHVDQGMPSLEFSKEQYMDPVLRRSDRRTTDPCLTRESCRQELGTEMRSVGN